MSPLAELTSARIGYRAAVQRARETLHRQEREYQTLCERLERAERDLRAAGYLREPR
jgi:hypothetical protein